MGGSLRNPACRRHRQADLGDFEVGLVNKGVPDQSGLLSGYVSHKRVMLYLRKGKKLPGLHMSLPLISLLSLRFQTLFVGFLWFGGLRAAKCSCCVLRTKVAAMS